MPRRSSIPDGTADEIRRLAGDGASYRAIANVFGVTRDQVERLVNPAGYRKRKAEERARNISKRRTAKRGKRKRCEGVKRGEHDKVAFMLYMPGAEFDRLADLAHEADLPLSEMIRRLCSSALEAA